MLAGTVYFYDDKEELIEEIDDDCIRKNKNQT